MKLASESDQGFTCFRLHVRGVDDRQRPPASRFARDEVQHLKRIFGGGLVVFVVGDQAPAEVGRKNFGGLEMLPARSWTSRSRRGRSRTTSESSGIVMFTAGKLPSALARRLV